MAHLTGLHFPGFSQGCCPVPLFLQYIPARRHLGFHYLLVAHYPTQGATLLFDGLLPLPHGAVGAEVGVGVEDVLLGGVGLDEADGDAEGHLAELVLQFRLVVLGADAGAEVNLCIARKKTGVN